MKVTQVIKNLRDKDISAIESEIKDLQRAHFNLRMQKGMQRLSNINLLGIARRDIARAKTILAQKKVANNIKENAK